MNRRSTRRLAPWILALVIVAGWAIAAMFLPATVLPGPARVVARLVRDLGSGQMWSAIGQTLLEAVAGAVLAAIIALPLGYLVARSRLASAALGPYIALSQSMPAVAIAPLLVVWVGYGLAPIALLCAIVAFFPMTTMASVAFRSIDREIIEAAELDGAGRSALLWGIEVPLALPTLVAGVRAGVALSITGAVVGEFVMGGEGLGARLTTTQSSGDQSGLYATLLALAAIAIVLNVVMRLVEDAARERADAAEGRGRRTEALAVAGA